jgi:hypothetical protein
MLRHALNGAQLFEPPAGTEQPAATRWSPSRWLRALAAR